MSQPTITIQLAASLTSVTRQRRHASGDGRSAIDLDIYREGNSVKVGWSVNRGAGWSRRWHATRKTEADAIAFADAKWPTLLAWLEKVVPVEGGGAAAAFSAQVASMSL